MHDDLPEVGKDIEELMHMGAEQKLCVERVQVFNPDDFPAFKASLHGHFPVAVQRKRFHWETYTFIKAYTRPEDLVSGE